MTNTLLNPSDFHLLHYFAVVAEENNLHRAAERLFMSQPPLSRHIKRLEERLGLTLFIRHTKGLTLTDDGARVLAAIRPLLKAQGSAPRIFSAASTAQVIVVLPLPDRGAAMRNCIICVYP